MGVSQGGLLSIVLYGVTLAPLEEELQVSYSVLIAPFYSNDADFDSSLWGSVRLISIIMERGPISRCFSNLSKSLFISDTPDQEASAKWDFVAERLP